MTVDFLVLFDIVLDVTRILMHLRSRVILAPNLGSSTNRAGDGVRACDLGCYWMQMIILAIGKLPETFPSVN